MKSATPAFSGPMPAPGKARAIGNAKNKKYISNNIKNMNNLFRVITIHKVYRKDSYP